MLSVTGGGLFLGTWLVTPPPPLSSAANGASVSRAVPVKTPSTVSRVLPTVSTNPSGLVRWNEHGAVQVHHRLGVPPGTMPSAGSPASAVAFANELRAVVVPNPGIGNRFANRSLPAKNP